MIINIISGAQTTSGVAALDAAVKLKTPYGGWRPKTRPWDKHRHSESYDLKVLPTDSYPQYEEQNLIDSDGTVFIEEGKISDRSARTLKKARKHNRHYLYINLDQLSEFQAAASIVYWLKTNAIETLYVNGAKSFQGTALYKSVKRIIKSVICSGYLAGWPACLPDTFDEAVYSIITSITHEGRVRIGKLSGDEIIHLGLTLHCYVDNKCNDSKISRELIECCTQQTQKDIDEACAFVLLIGALWKNLSGRHHLRVTEIWPQCCEYGRSVSTSNGFGVQDLAAAIAG